MPTLSNLVAPVTTVEMILLMARSYRWIRETQGANKGEVVNHILKTVGLAPGQPWCAAFVATIGKDAFGDDWPLPLVGGVATLAEAAAQQRTLMKFPAPGAIFLLWGNEKGRFHHTGFVGEPSGTGWKTVEGNTNDDGSAEGIGVFTRYRIFAPRDRFIYWWAPPSDPANSDALAA